MRFTPHAFVTQLAAHHEISRDTIEQTKIVYHLVKQYGERVLMYRLLETIGLEEDMISYMRFLQQAKLLSSGLLRQVLTIMRQHVDLVYPDVTVTHEHVKVSMNAETYERHVGGSPGVRMTYKADTYKRTLDIDLQKMLPQS